MPKETTDQSFEEEILRHQGVALVDFWAPWCGPCRRIGPIVEELAATYEGRAKIVKLNVDETRRHRWLTASRAFPRCSCYKTASSSIPWLACSPKRH